MAKPELMARSARADPVAAGAAQPRSGLRIRDVEAFPMFRDRCAAALATLTRDAGRGRNAVLFGSAGSLAAAMQPALGLADWDLLRLKLTFFNSGVSSFE